MAASVRLPFLCSSRVMRFIGLAYSALPLSHARQPPPLAFGSDQRLCTQCLHRRCAPHPEVCGTTSTRSAVCEAEAGLWNAVEGGGLRLRQASPSSSLAGDAVETVARGTPLLLAVPAGPRVTGARALC